MSISFKADEGQNIIPSLEDLAFETVYYKIVCKTTEDMIESIRNYMDQKLVGRVNKSVREKCIEKWYENNRWNRLNKEPSETIDLNVEIFLDCILDTNIFQLKTDLPMSNLKSFSILMSIIAHRSPELKTLFITLRDPTYDQQKTFENLKEKRLELAPFHHLQCLTIVNKSRITPPQEFESHQSFLSIVGKCCPSLCKLELFGSPISKRDILALLIVEDVADILFPYNNDDEWSRDSVLESLRLPFQYLNPLCFTLENLSLQYWGMIWKDSTLVFALCHLPNLRKLETMGHGLDIVKAIKTIYKVEGTLKNKVNFMKHLFQTREKSREVELEEILRKSNVSRESIGGFSGFLQLEKIKFIQLNDKETVKAVGSLCPHLKDIGFFESLGGPHALLSNELDRTLNGWSKVNVLSLTRILPQCVEPVVKIFNGFTLKSLSLTFCGQINLKFLESCTQLEELTIKRCSIEPKVPTGWTGEKTFLPLLKKFESELCCLGPYWGSLFERKSTIVHLTLECCHFGTPAYNPRLEWNQVGDLWPNLETLELYNCTGLTMPILSENVIPRLGRLKIVKLPLFMLCRDNELYNKITQNLRNRKDDEPVQIIDTNWGSLRFCPFQRHV